MVPQPIHHSSIPLTKNWTFKQGDRASKDGFLPAGDLPTEIHRDLHRVGKIEDPFNDLNELSVRWVADETWTYRVLFDPPSDHKLLGVRTFLKFEGLDTFAAVYLNSDHLLDSDNMFVEHNVDVSSRLLDGKNTLDIVFTSARKNGLEIVEKHKEHKFIVHQTEISRGPVRKAQYHWGWDWGPILMTCGPWKPILLETYQTKITDLWAEYELSGDLKTAKGSLYARIDGSPGAVEFTISEKSGGRQLAHVEGTLRDGIAEASFDVDVLLWWPRNYGPQTLYTITAALTTPESPASFSSEKPLHSLHKSIGFRKTELIQNSGSTGTSFYLRINNIDIFSGGSCWIPADSFLSSITSERYRQWIKLAAAGNQAMIRVWGGGIYESDAFYEACDEFGVLVWQDFMFACANYPAYDSYLASIELEARQNVQRLRNHPSIVIWAGNNEDYQIVERYNLEYRFEEDKDPQSWLKTDFPARYIYEYLLPKVVKEELKGIPYHPSSPFGNGTSTTLKVDATVGDIHQWNVWHGEMKPYQKLPEMGGRFVSEFGMEAYPHVETLERYITSEEDRYPGSMAMDFRNKAIGHERRLISYVAENFRIMYDLRGFTHLTQVMQADAMSWAYKSWRRKWGSEGNRHCGGVLVWQLNDCWPTMSWAVVDYHLVPKPSYYAIKRAMEPLVVGVTRNFVDWTMRPADELWKRDTSHIDMRKLWEDVKFDVWVASSKNEELEGKIVVKFISVRSGKEVQNAIEEDVTITANATTEIIQDRKIDALAAQDSRKPFQPSKGDPFVIYATLCIDGRLVASDASWPDPVKYLGFSDRGLNVQYSASKAKATISAAKPVKGFVFSDKQGIGLSDNGFDIMPGESKEVSVTEGLIDSLQWTYVEK